MKVRRMFNGSFITLIRGLFLIIFLWTILDVLHVRKRLQSNDDLDLIRRSNQRIFVTSIHWNNEEILRSHWIPAVIKLATQLGPDRVFVSVYESGSWDDTKSALRDLDHQLAVASIPRSVRLDESTHRDLIEGVNSFTNGTVQDNNGSLQLRRIPYLAKARNIALEPLTRIANASYTFNKILFLNDVVFTTDDVWRLLATRDGQYAAACSMDFEEPPSFYDTFALRDAAGQAAVMQNWPYFRSRRSRHALLNGKPVPVKSCWNGMVAMDAAPFTQRHNFSFRAIPDELAEQHLEGSECCLIHADNKLTTPKGVWINPHVRVGYSPSAYAAVNTVRPWLSHCDIARGIWQNRLLRLFTTDWLSRSTIRRRIREWTSRSIENVENGIFCIIDEMQILVWNGWAHI